MSNYTYADGAVHHDHHKELTVNVSGKADIAALVKAFMAEDAEDAQEVSPDATPEKTVLPEVLCTPQAEALLSKLRTAGMLDERWQPVGLSNAEKGLLADFIAERLDLTAHWQCFSALWGMKPEVLRSAFHKGLEQKKSLAFRERLEEVAG